MSLNPPTDPDSIAPNPRVHALAELASAGVPDACRELVADALGESSQVGLTELQNEVFRRIESGVRRLSWHASFLETREDWLVQALLVLDCPARAFQGGPPQHDGLPETPREAFDRTQSRVQSWLSVMPELDLAPALLTRPVSDRMPTQERCLLGALHRAGRLDLTRFVDIRRAAAGSDQSGRRDHTAPWFWFATLRDNAFAAFLPLVEAASDDEAGAVAFGILDAFRRLTLFDPSVSEDYAPDPPPEAVSAWVAHLQSRLERRPEDPGLAASLWTIMCAELTFDLDESTEAGLVEFSLRRLSRFRKELADGDVAEGTPWQEWGQVVMRGLEAVYVVGEGQKALKAVLLLLRESPYATVGDDLRSWHESTDLPEEAGGPPTRWRWLAEAVLGTAHACARDIRKEDAQLLELREFLARYCLDRLRSRLKDRKAAPSGDEDMLEPSPNWRLAYVESARALRVNPGKRGHRVLHWLRANDPNEEVRAKAVQVYDEMVKGVRLPPRTSAMRAVTAAMWWMRWAHRTALGLSVDHAAAQRTRQKEVRRTREVSDIQGPTREQPQ